MLHTDRTPGRGDGATRWASAACALRDTQNKADNVESSGGQRVHVCRDRPTARTRPSFEAPALALENGYIKVVPGSTAMRPARPAFLRRARRRCGLDHIYRQAITSAGTGCMAALDAERYLSTVLADACKQPLHAKVAAKKATKSRLYFARDVALLVPNTSVQRPLLAAQ